ncbi:Cytoplasmic glyoxalase II [Serendipita sp. 411]|nr:Cytoplasmic glyoxalase II [Serendipita sp. 411]
MLLRLSHIQRLVTRRPSSLASIVASQKRNMKIVSIPIRSDNYMYVLMEERTGTGDIKANNVKALLVDPADPKALEKVSTVLEEEGAGSVDIVGVLTTHHHEDHAGGNDIVVKAIPSASIYGGKPKDGPPRVRAVTNLVADGDEISLGDSIKIKCLATPCHTQDSICYYVTDGDQKAVFAGDTLFQGGCGRFFEGTPEEMHSSLSYLGQLPDETIVYNGHEYTRGNLKFAKTVEPMNDALSRLEQLCDSNEITTGKSTIGDEKQWNVFMRLDIPAIRQATGGTDAAAVMGKLRELKNAM